MKDIDYFDQLPESIKFALREAPKPFSAKFAWQLLKQHSEQQVLSMLKEAIEAEISDGTMPPCKPFRPIGKREHKL